MKYTEKIHSAVLTAIKAMKQLDAEKAEAQKTFAGDRLNTEMENIFKQREQIRMDTLATIESARSAYKAAVERGTELDGSMLHPDAQILKSGITLTAHQFTAMVQKHKDNPLMTQLLQQYQNQHDGLYCDFVPSADTKIFQFGKFCDTARTVLNSPDNLQAAFFEAGKYAPACCTENE